MEPSFTKATAPARPKPHRGVKPIRQRTRGREVALLTMWLVVVFVVTTLLVWRLAVAKLPALPMPVNPLHLVVALVVAAVGGALIVGVIVMYPSAGLFLLAMTAPLEETLYLTLGGFRVKPYEAMLLGLVVALLVRRQMRVDRLSGVLVAYMLFGLVSLGFDLGAPLFTSLQIIVFELLMALLFIATRATILVDAWDEEPPWLARIRIELEWALASIVSRLLAHRAWDGVLAKVDAADDTSDRYVARARRLTVFYVLVVGNAIALYGLGQFVGYYIGLPIPYFHPEVYAIFRPYSTFIEPNPFGTFLTGQIALALTLLLSPEFRRWRVALGATLALQFALLAVNLSRGSWLAAALVVVVIVVVRFYRAPDLDLRRVGAVLAGACVTLAAAAGLVALWSPTITRAIMVRLNSFTNLNGGTLHWRTSDFLLALQIWALKPVVGYGPGTWGAAAYGFVGKAAVTSPRNIFTAWLFERGLVGALLAIGFYKLFIERAIRAYRFAPQGQRRTLILAYGMATVAVFIGFLSASAEIVPYYWFQLGVLAALTDVVLLTPPAENAHAHRT